MDSPVLCIVDVQPHFGAARNVVDEVVRQIGIFRKIESPIAVVEYKSAGETYHPVLSALEGYNKTYRITKDQDDGSEEVALALRGVLSKRIVMCGVNTCFCVSDTAYGLVFNHGYKVQLAEKALWCEYCDFGGGSSCVQQQRIRLRLAERVNGLRQGDI